MPDVTVRMPPEEEQEPTTIPYARVTMLGQIKERIGSLGRTIAKKISERRATKRKMPWKRRLRRWAWRIVTATSILLGLAFFGFAGLIWYYGRDLPETSELQHYDPPQLSRILARDGSPLAELYTERRTVVSIDQVPKVMKLAVLAAEDANFYKHEGLNYFGILRALIVNLRSGRAQQGGSTITQQVVKNVLLTPERTFARKIRELILARRIEQELKKDQILELYLNRIYLGHGRYGIEEAARYYFGKSVGEVTLAEAALLAGLVKGPSIYSPHVDRARAKERRRYVLEQMRSKGFAAPGDVDSALRQEIALATPVEKTPELAPEALAEVERELETLLGERAKRGGFTVTTTIDRDLQAAARRAVRENLDAYAARHKLQAPAHRKPDEPFEGMPEAALVAVDVRTAEVLAIVGGYGARRGTFNRARAAHRQPASSFKPIVYSYAIHSRSFTAATILETNPAALGDKYRPGNYDESEGRAPSRLREALAHSVNVAAVWTLQKLGPDKVVAWAKQLGISSKLGADLSLALGSYEVTPFEMVAAYTTFAAGGVYREPTVIRRIVDQDGEEIPVTRKEQRVMDEAVAYIMTSLLRSVVEVGTGKRARSLPFPVVGKTGTSNANKDAWFVGYSPEVACAVWTGFDNAASLGAGETGAVTSLPAFIAFMQEAHKSKARSDFAVPSQGIVRASIEGGMEEIFLAGTEPTEPAAPTMPRLFPF